MLSFRKTRICVQMKILWLCFPYREYVSHLFKNMSHGTLYHSAHHLLSHCGVTTTRKLQIMCQHFSASSKMCILLHLSMILYPCMGGYWSLLDNCFLSVQESFRRRGTRAYNLCFPRPCYGLGYIKSEMGKGNQNETSPIREYSVHLQTSPASFNTWSVLCSFLETWKLWFFIIKLKWPRFPIAFVLLILPFLN